MRVLRLAGRQQANLTALMLTVAGESEQQQLQLSHQLQHRPADSSQTTGTKFQGEIHFGLFGGLKVLNYGFGDRVSQLSGEFRMQTNRRPKCTNKQLAKQ